LAQQSDLDSEVALLDYLTLPDRLQEFGSRDGLAVGAGENCKDRGTTAANRDRTALSLQDHARTVERKGAELN
jgi:hypothetical protein